MAPMTTRGARNLDLLALATIRGDSAIPMPGLQRLSFVQHTPADHQGLRLCRRPERHPSGSADGIADFD